RSEEVGSVLVYFAARGEPHAEAIVPGNGHPDDRGRGTDHGRDGLARPPPRLGGRPARYARRRPRGPAAGWQDHPPRPGPRPFRVLAPGLAGPSPGTRPGQGPPSRRAGPEGGPHRTVRVQGHGHATVSGLPGHRELGSLAWTVRAWDTAPGAPSLGAVHRRRGVFAPRPHSG